MDHWQRGLRGWWLFEDTVATFWEAHICLNGLRQLLVISWLVAAQEHLS